MKFTQPFLTHAGIVISLLFSFFHISAQENYQPGYAILANLDTVEGFIDYRGWRKNPTQISFRKNESEPSRFYSPKEVLEFSVSGEKYIGAEVNLEVSPTNTDALEKQPELNIVKESVFLQTIFGGEKTLFYHIAKSGKENFYIAGNQGPELLAHKKYYKYKDGVSTLAEDNTYRVQLGNYLSDCRQMLEEIALAHYDLTSFREIFQNYYKCAETSPQFERKREPILMKAGVLLGGTLTKLDFNSYGFDYLVRTEFSPSYNITGGLFLELILPRTQNKLSIQNEFIFSQYQTSANYEVFEHDNFFTFYESEFAYSYLKLNTLIRYTYPARQFHVYINGGFSNGFAISETNYREKETTFFSSNLVFKEKALEETRRYEQGLIVGIGTKYRRFSSEIRIENGGGMSKQVALGSLARRFILLVGYQF